MEEREVIGSDTVGGCADRGGAGVLPVEVVVAAETGDRMDALLHALADPDWRVRRAAAVRLPEVGNDAVMAALFDLLASEDAGERNAAIKVFVRMGSRGLEHLIRGLSFPDPDVRNFCALAVGLIGDRSVTGEVIAAFDAEEDPNVRYMLVEAMGRLNDPVAVPTLMRALEEDAWIKAPAVDALGRMHCTSAVTALVRVLSDPEVGGIAADALGRMRDVRAVLPLATAAADAPDTTAVFFLTALKEILDSPAQETALLMSELRALLPEEQRLGLQRAVERALHDSRVADVGVAVADWLDSPHLLSGVIAAMVDVSLHDAGLQLVARWMPRVDPSTVPALSVDACVHGLQVLLEAAAAVGFDGDTGWIEDALGNANPMVAAAAARALGAAGGVRSGYALVALLTNVMPEVRKGAAAGIAAIGADAYVTDLFQMAEEGDDAERLAVADVLAARGGWSHPDLIRAALILSDDSEPDIRCAIARAIPNAPGELADTLTAHLTADPEDRIRDAAYQALGRTHTENAHSFLRVLMDSEDVSVRVAALRWLTANATPEDADVFIAAAGDPDVRVRISALGGLSVVTSKDALPVVRRLLDEEDPDLYRSALTALAAADAMEAAAVALGAIYSPAWQVRVAAIEVLGTVGGDDARSAVRRALSDEDADVRASAIHACPRVFGGDCVQELLGLVSDERVGMVARDALLQVACDARDAVFAHLPEAEGRARSALLSILASLGEVDDDLIGDLLRSESEEDRFYGALASRRASREAKWAMRSHAAAEPDPGVALVMGAVVAESARSAGSPHA